MALMWRELTTDHPVIGLPRSATPTEVVGTLLACDGRRPVRHVVHAAGFLQSNLHMTAQQTGIVLLPGAAGDGDLDGSRRTPDKPIRSAPPHHDRCVLFAAAPGSCR